MVPVPAIVFYIATVALILVCAFIATLLFYLIRAARIATEFASFLEIEMRRFSRNFSRLRRVASFASSLFE